MEGRKEGNDTITPRVEVAHYLSVFHFSYFITGALLKMISVGERVCGITVHPTCGDVVMCAVYDGVLKQVDIDSGDVMWDVKGTNYWCADVLYHHSGTTINCPLPHPYLSQPEA